MRLYILALIISVFSSTIYGQNEHKIDGVIKNTDKELLQGAVIKSLTVKDSTLICATLSNDVGAFSLKVHAAQCILEIKVLGYKVFYKTLKMDNRVYHYPISEISLEELPVNIDEVIVIGNAPAMSMKGDTLEYNTSSYSLPEYASVRDLLKVLPNVNVSNEGIITVQGKEVKKILVDGREFFSGDPDLASKALPSKIVDKVQVIDKASKSSQLSGFDGNEKETVINLEIKEKMKTATMINANVGLGHDLKKDNTRYENAAFVNIMNNKSNYTIFMQNNNTNGGAGGDIEGFQKTNQIGLNINQDFSNNLKISSDIVYDSNNNRMDNRTENRTILSPKEFIYDNSHQLNRSRSKSFNANSKAEWTINDQNILYVQVNGRYNHRNTHRVETFASLNNLLDTLYNGNSNVNSNGDDYVLGVATEYAYNFHKKGRVFSSSFIGNIGNSDGTDISAWKQRLFDNNIFDRDSLINQRVSNKNPNKKLLFSLSYVEPITEKILIQLAYKIQSSFNTQNRKTYDIVNSAPNEFVESINQSQSIDSKQNYTEQWFTLNFKSTSKKTTYGIGANIILNRAQNTSYQGSFDLSGDSLISLVNQNSILYSPTINFKYVFDSRNSLNIDYEGLMTPPSPIQTQDYTNTNNPTNSIKGNPNLKPQFDNKIVVSFKGSNPKRQTFYKFSIQGQLLMDEIRPTTTIDIDTGKKMTMYKNLNGNWKITMNSIFDMPLKNKKIKIGNSFNLYLDRKNSIFNDANRYMKRLILYEKPHIRYYTDNFNFKIEGRFNYINARSNVREHENIKTYDWGGNFDFSYLLPYKIRLGSTLNWNNKSGYNRGSNYSETIVNCMASKTIFTSTKLGEGIIKFTAYDILQNRRNFTQTIEDNSIQNNVSSTIGCYFMGTFIYNFNLFPNNN